VPENERERERERKRERRADAGLAKDFFGVLRRVKVKTKQTESGK
jgi:hypothetical protein